MAISLKKISNTDILVEDRDEEKHAIYARVLRFINILLWVSGMAVISTGAYVNIDMADANVLLGPDVYYASNVMLIICGIIIVVFSFLSCFDTFFKKRITLCILTYCLCIVFVTQSVIAALSFTWNEEIDYFLGSRLNRFVQERYHPNLRGTSAFIALDKIQQRFQCCGAQNYTDWRTSKWLIVKNDSSAIPLSCCKIAVSIADCNLKNLRNIFTKGCSEPLIEKYETNFLIMGIVSIVISLFQLLCFHISNYLMFKLE